MRINNENFLNNHISKREKKFINRAFAIGFLAGLAIGVWLGYWVLSKKITEQSETIERQERLIELYELSDK